MFNTGIPALDYKLATARYDQLDKESVYLITTLLEVIESKNKKIEELTKNHAAV